MATTWIKALHISKTMTASSAIADIIDYVENPQKTDNGRLITSYHCNSRTVDEEFVLTKKEYEYITGRNQGRHDVIAYHIRQSFKPGEVTPEEANEIGYQLAMSFTKGNHAFVVCTHTDKAHVHNHIIFNSTSINCERKFKNFFFSGRAVRHISDLLCAEHGLSVIENPRPSKGSYADWLGDKKEPSHQELLRQKIDKIIPSCSTFDDFLSRLKTDGYEVNESRKHISVKAPDWNKPVRLDTLKGNYTESVIRTRVGMKDTIAESKGNRGIKDTPAEHSFQVGLLIDIQSKIQSGKGAGYAQWAKVFNLKEAAKTLIYLKENGIDSYDDLVTKSAEASGDFVKLTGRIKEIEARQKEIAVLQKEIGIYGKTRDIYAKYKASGWNHDYYDAHSADIIRHRAAKKYFDNLGMKKLPSINQLRQEYGNLASERKTLYGEYHKLKDLSHELSIAKANTERILDIKPNAQNHDTLHVINQHENYEK